MVPRSGTGRSRWLRLGWLSCLFVALMSVAAEARQLTLREQAHINVLKEYLPPHHVDGIVRKLDEIDQNPNLTPEQKHDASQRLLDKELRRANRAAEQARAGGDTEGADRATKIALIIQSLRNTYFGSPGTVPEEVQREEARLEEERKKAEEERKKAEARGDVSFVPQGPGDISFYGAGQIGHFQGPNNPFLATEFGPGTLDLGVVNFEPQGTAYGFTGGGRAWFPGVHPGGANFLFADGSVRFISFSDHQSLGTFETGGASLGIPGTGDPAAAFPEGVLLGFFDGANTVTDMAGSFDYQAVGGGIAVGLGMPLVSERLIPLSEKDRWNSPVILPFVGVDISHIDQKTRFSGSVPGFDLDFFYLTDLDILQISPKAGAEFIFPILTNPEGPPLLSARVKGTVYIDTLFFDGTDQLELDGPADDLQSADLDGSDTKVGFAIEGGVMVHPPGTPFSFTLFGGFEQRGNAAVIHRSGETGEQSQAKSATTDSAYGMISLSLHLGINPARF